MDHIKRNNESREDLLRRLGACAASIIPDVKIVMEWASFSFSSAVKRLSGLQGYVTVCDSGCNATELKLQVGGRNGEITEGNVENVARNDIVVNEEQSVKQTD